MPEQNETKQGNRLIYALTPLLLLLLTGSLLLLVYVLTPTHQLQRYLNLAFMDDLKTTSQTSGLHIIEQDINRDNPDDTYEKGEIQFPKFGEQYAELYAPSINLDVGVYYGTNSEMLSRGACQSTQSAVIGDTGNTVIDAHVNTFFADLDKLETGDEIVLYTKYGNFTYRVTEKIKFDKNDKRYVAATKDNHLTLYTCKPQVLGSSDVRIGVRCEPVSWKFYRKAAD